MDSGAGSARAGCGYTTFVVALSSVETVVLALLALAAWRLIRHRRVRSLTLQTVMDLLRDADAARSDPLLIHQARRRIHSSRSDHG